MEVWKPIIGYEGLYEVSDKGHVRSLDRYVKNHGESYYFRPGALKTPRAKKNKYLVVDLYRDNEQKTCHVHRLVAEAFIDNPDNKSTVNHKDGNVRNNSVNNLEWATPEEQNKHFYAMGLKSKNNIKKAITAMNAANSRRIRCVETGRVFKSVMEAAKFLNKKDGSALSACCRGKRHTAYGFTWAYA